MGWKRAKWKRKIKAGEEGGRGRKFVCSDDQHAGAPARERPPALEELWARWWWGCTDGLEPGSQLTPLYGPCSLITTDDVRESKGERGREGELSGGSREEGGGTHTSRWQDEERNLWQILGTIRHNVAAAWQLIRNDTDFSQCNRCCLISPARENPAPATFHAQFNHLKGMKYLMHCKASTAVSLVRKFPSQKYACFM